MSVFIIAEAGDNHNGDIALAYQLVDAAVAAKADCVKFQTFITEEIIVENAVKADYQIAQTGAEESQFEMLKKLELSFEQFSDLQRYCQSKGILFMSTPFDLISVDFLATLDMPFVKIPSGEITNLPYLIAIAEMTKPIIMSTGMATLVEVGDALNVLRERGAKDITVLHCNTEYPTPMCDVNLQAMQTIADTYGVPVGYSDHTQGIEVPVAAVALGATVIEKHFTLDKTMEGPDHQASLEPDELAAMVTAIRNIERALGSAEKVPSPSEQKNIAIARKSIVAACAIRAGDVFSVDNLAVKRPGDGLSPMLWFELMGTSAKRAYQKDEQIAL